VLAALLSSDASKFSDADRRFVRAMIALGGRAEQRHGRRIRHFRG
jgi:hypothetical protein